MGSWFRLREVGAPMGTSNEFRAAGRILRQSPNSSPQVCLSYAIHSPWLRTEPVNRVGCHSLTSVPYIEKMKRLCCCNWDLKSGESESLSHVWLFATPWTIESMEFSRPEYWSEEPFPSPGDLPGIKLRSPALQADSLPAEPQGKPKNTGVGSLSLLQGIVPTQESNQGLLNCRRILYQLSYKGKRDYLEWIWLTRGIGSLPRRHSLSGLEAANSSGVNSSGEGAVSRHWGALHLHGVECSQQSKWDWKWVFSTTGECSRLTVWLWPCENLGRGHS